ncbi:MAG: hypothetical protein EHM70_01065 [Chloroflexota bacterium]|nr:MAG: hypothetical protein EHM70_01065 [Chloroflexota bacterium]
MTLSESVHQALQYLAERPAWLEAALQPDTVLQALNSSLPEAVSGRFLLTGVTIPGLFLEDRSGRWKGVYHLSLEENGVEKVYPLRVTLTPPNIDLPVDVDSLPEQPFGSDGWSSYLPELRLYIEMEPPEQALDGLEQLLDPEAARSLIETSIRGNSPAYRDFTLRACEPQVLNYKPGSRCTIRYLLDYPPQLAGYGWPQAVVAKTYRTKKGERAFRGMQALWHSPLAEGDIVRISEPLAYDPGLRLLIQDQLPEDLTLEELLRSELSTNSSEPNGKLYNFVRKVAAGLAMLHRSGAHTEETVTFDERFEDVPDILARLAVAAPEIPPLFEPLANELKTRAAGIPPDPMVPSHGTFDADQVLISGEEIGFIDFDNFCMAEPSVDVSHFRASLVDSGMKLAGPETLADPEQLTAYLSRLNDLSEVFLEQYLTFTPVSRQRLALWEALDYLRDVLHYWKKPKPGAGTNAFIILENHLNKMGLDEA